jgi:hypothetical protein
MNRIISVGHIGTDAGGWYIGADGKVHRIPGWNPEQLADFLARGDRTSCGFADQGAGSRAVGGLTASTGPEGGWKSREGRGRRSYRLT